MSRIFFVITLFCFWSAQAQVFNQRIADHTALINHSGKWLQQYEAFGIKSTGTAQIDSVRDWLMASYTMMGVEDIRLDTFRYLGKNAYNLVVDLPGSINEWVLVLAHYDSKEGGYGTNDNGTGVAACLQIVEQMVRMPHRKGIRILHFSGEEQGYLGSRHYVKSLEDSVALVLNLDQLGGTKGADNSQIICERDENDNPFFNNEASANVTDTLARLVQLYTTLTPVLGRAFGSDYVPFEDSGYVITGLYQASDYPFYHTPADSLGNVDTVATNEVVKGALAAVMHFSQHQLSARTSEPSFVSTLVYPNPTTGVFHVKPTGRYHSVVVYNQSGSLVAEQQIEKTSKVQLNQEPGVYFVELQSKTKDRVQRSKLIIAPH